MVGYYGTRGGQSPATTAIAKLELGDSAPALPHLATALRTTTTTNFWEAPPIVAS